MACARIGKGSNLSSKRRTCTEIVSSHAKLKNQEWIEKFACFSFQERGCCQTSMHTFTERVVVISFLMILLMRSDE